MLANDYADELNRLIDSSDCHVVLPEDWADGYFAETGVEPTTYHERRRHPRFRLRTKAILKMEQAFPAITRSSEAVVVYTCDVGRGGLGFLHSEQLYPGEECELWLTTRRMHVQVSRCRFHNPQCFQIGVKPL